MSNKFKDSAVINNLRNEISTLDNIKVANEIFIKKVSELQRKIIEAMENDPLLQSWWRFNVAEFK